MSTAVRALIALLVVSACTPTTAPPTGAPVEQPVRGGVIVEPISPDITTLQPVLAAQGNAARATEKIYETLLDWDPHTGEPRPRLGTWTIADEGRLYSWRLAENATWSDGQPIVAADFLTSVRAVGRSKLTSRKRSLEDVEGFAAFAAGQTDQINGVAIDPSDPKRFTVRLTRAFCPALTQAFPLPLLPTHVFGRYLGPGARDEIDRAAENDAPTIVSGPFVLKEWRRGESVSFVRNDRFWRGAPYLEGYEFRVVAPERWPELIRAGALSHVQLPQTVGPDWEKYRAAVESNGRLQTHTTHNGYTFIGWNTQSMTAPALRDRRVRQALAYGIDVDTVLQRIVGGGQRNLAHTPAYHWAYPAGLKDYAHDAARARQLIEEAGFSRGSDGYYSKDGRALSFSMQTHPDNPNRVAMLQLAIDQYRAIGVRVTPVMREYFELAKGLTEGDDIESVILGFSLGPDPDAYPVWHTNSIPDRATRRTGTNLFRLSNAALDAALEAGRHGPDCSLAKRKEQYAIVNRILNEEQPAVFGFTQTYIRALPANLRGFEASPLPGADMFSLHRWWLAPEKK